MTAQELEQARKRLELSKIAFARAFGVTERTVRRWERGHPIPKPIAVLVRLALESAGARRELGIEPAARRTQED
jgi:DNA-binding transcriptional regulator YiaG